jgi:hypothetical protein
MDWPFWLVSPKLLHYKRGNSGKGRKESQYCCRVLAQSLPVLARLSSWLKLGWILIEEHKSWASGDAFFGAKRLLLNVY